MTKKTKIKHISIDDRLDSLTAVTAALTFQLFGDKVSVEDVAELDATIDALEALLMDPNEVWEWDRHWLDHPAARIAVQTAPDDVCFQVVVFGTGTVIDIPRWRWSSVRKAIQAVEARLPKPNVPGFPNHNVLMTAIKNAKDVV